MTAHIFQQAAASPSDQTPWPVVFDGTTVVHGRPDAANLVGFVNAVEPHKILVFASEVATVLESSPAQITGLTPVFIGHDGNMFGVTLPVREVSEYTGDVVALAAANAELVAAL